MTNKKLGILGLFTASMLATAQAQEKPKEYLDVGKGTNNVYDESNFYGEVINVHRLSKKDNQQKGYSSGKYANEIVIMGERGTIVTVKTNDDFSLNEKVLFKSSKDSDYAKVIKVPNPSLEDEVGGENPLLYTDVNNNQQFYKDVNPQGSVLDYKKTKVY